MHLYTHTLTHTHSFLQPILHPAKTGRERSQLGLVSAPCNVGLVSLTDISCKTFPQHKELPVDLVNNSVALKNGRERERVLLQVYNNASLKKHLQDGPRTRSDSIYLWSGLQPRLPWSC